MHPEMDYLFATLLREDREREAAHQRLLALAARRPRERVPIRARILAVRRRVGYRLIEIGLRLAVTPEPRPR
jgi:hypothetical protein